MEKFYKGLLKTAKKDENGMFHANIDDIYKIFEKQGYWRYDFGGETIFSPHELTQEEYDNYKKEYDEALNKAVDNLAKDINKEILRELFKEYKEYVNKKGTTEEG